MGFQSLGSFSTLFRRVVGYPPAVYRTRRLVAVPSIVAPPASRRFRARVLSADGGRLVAVAADAASRPILKSLARYRSGASRAFTLAASGAPPGAQEEGHDHQTLTHDDLRGRSGRGARFYTEKLGFKVRMDMAMDNGFRWTTIGLASQPNSKSC